MICKSKPKPINLALPITPTQPFDTSDPAPIWATTEADPDGGAALGRLGAPGLLDAISDLIEPFSPEEQVMVDRALAKIAASRAVRGAF